MEMGRITTGVDKLLRLLEEKGKISTIEAVAHLSVAKEVVEEWIELLEHEKLVTVTYKFSKQYIEIKNTSSEPVVKESMKKVTSEQEAFRRKIDVAIKEIDKETAGFEALKHHYEQVQRDIKDEMKTVHAQMTELERFDDLRSHVEKDIEKQKKDFERFVSTYDKEVKRYEEQYKSFVAEIIIEEKKIDTVKKKVDALKKEKEETEKVIQDSVQKLKDISKEFTSHLRDAETAEKQVEKISKKLGDMQSGVDKKKEDFIVQLAKKIGAKNEKLEIEHEELLRSAKERVKLIQEYTVHGKKAYQDFNKLFMNKIKTFDLFQEIENEKLDLIADLKKLKKEVDGFTVALQYAKMKKQVGDVEKVIENYNKRKHSLMQKIKKLLDFIDK